MSQLSLFKFYIFCLIILSNKTNGIQSIEYVEFINENGTNLLSDFKNVLMLRQDVTPDGSGETITDTTALYTTTIFASTAVETTSIQESTTTLHADTTTTSEGATNSSVEYPTTFLSSSATDLAPSITAEQTSFETTLIFSTHTNPTSSTTRLSSNSTTIATETSYQTTVFTVSVNTTTTTGSSSTPATTTYKPDTCNTTAEVKLPNGTCVLKAKGQQSAYNTLQSNSTDATTVTSALLLYISSITNTSTTLDDSITLELDEIDSYLTNIINGTINQSTDTSFIMIQPPKQSENDSVITLGASVIRNGDSIIINNSTIANVTNNVDLFTAAFVSEDSLVNVTSLNIMIIKDPTPFQDEDNSTTSMIVSSIVIASVKRNNATSNRLNISLYFKNVVKPELGVNEDYMCSFYDARTSTWNESGCSKPVYNPGYGRFECSCNHNSSFALIWSPRSSSTRTLDAQDIASLVFQSISILCFIAIIIHGLAAPLCNPFASILARHLLPLISCAVTMILFIFYIALTMTVYTHTSSPQQTQCFLSSTVLMFFTYFFLIFMFCVKTSVGCFNYLRFVHLFPEPSHQKLVSMLIISFFISITWVAFAAGFNSNPSFHITQLYAYRLCWFDKHVIHYFLTIPACLFIVINLIFLILVGYRIISHVRYATSRHQSYERMKRCVLVLLSSSITQGVGWLFGPLITILNPTAGNVLGWIFVIFNGLEGLWTIILYVIIRSLNMDEQKRVTARKDLTKSTSISSVKTKKGSKRDINRRSTKRSQVHNRKIQNRSYPLEDPYYLKTVNYTSQC